jgi:hypothetical protein
LLYARIALAVYALGLVLTVVYNIFNGRRGRDRLSLARKSAWDNILFLRGFLIYPSILVITYWSIQWNGIVMGIMAGVGAFIFKMIVNHVSWRMF